MVSEMLQRLAEGGGWPLDLVDAVYVFGSYARGALEPGDVDVAVDFRQDERMQQRTVPTSSRGAGIRASTCARH
ncbi:hypothetical protein SLUN_01715 [Streptomyces lunaelactis]|uniref:Polymerase nucleotidyl transferase domain-containing protein n=2 Tax=Streptomyces lunaelactis TaxID=1535768 RepID=A0A2R4SWC7_9ACTN|nr:hypothetical protein SLUN_01715 [Streptomyces lunaelactis]